MVIRICAVFLSGADGGEGGDLGGSQDAPLSEMADLLAPRRVSFWPSIGTNGPHLLTGLKC